MATPTQAFMNTPQGKKSVKIIVFLIVGLVVFLIVKYLVKELADKIKSWKQDRNFVLVINTTPTTDGTEIDPGFKPQAKILADAFQVAMEGSGTTESVLYGGTVELSGAQLQQVYAEFGSRDGFDLFGWYAADLGDSLSIDYPIGLWSWGDYGMTEAQGDALGAGFWWSEQDLMRAIWAKSGLPLSF